MFSPAAHVTGQPVLLGWQLLVPVIGSWHITSSMPQVLMWPAPPFDIFVCSAQLPLLSWMCSSCEARHTVSRDKRTKVAAIVQDV